MKKHLLSASLWCCSLVVCGCATNTSNATTPIAPKIHIFLRNSEASDEGAIPYRLRISESGTLFSVDFRTVSDENLVFYAESLGSSPHQVVIRLSVLAGNDDKISARTLAMTLDRILKALSTAKNALSANVRIDVLLNTKAPTD